MAEPKADNLPQTLKIGSLEIAAPCFQAALSGYSDRAMRKVARDAGAKLTFAGVMLDKVTLHPAALRKPVFAVGDDEHPIGGQILGTEPEMMAHAAKALHEIGYDVIDLNFACPAPKVLRRGRGGALLETPARLRNIYLKVRDAVSCPLMLKLRLGFKDNDVQRESVAQLCEQAADDGIDALVIHGRSVVQRYRDRADWSFMAQVKRALPHTTVVGSGDVFDAETAVARLHETGLDGVLLARGAIGNPWIFPETHALIRGEPKPAPPGITEQGRVILEHFNMVTEMYQPHKAVIYFRKFSIRYCKRHPERKKLHMDMLTAPTADEVRAVIRHWYGVG